MCWILKLFYNEIFDKFDWVLHLEILVVHGCRKRKKANMWHGRGNSGGSWPPAFHRSWCSSMRDWDKALKSRILTYPHSPPRFKMDTVIAVCLPDLPFIHSMIGSHKGWDFNNCMKIFIIVSPKVKFGLQSLAWFFIGGLNNLTKKTKR